METTSPGRPGSGPGAGPAPRRRAFDRRMWRELLNCLINFPLDLVGFIYIVVTVTVGVGLSFTLVGLPVLAGSLAGARGFGQAARARVRSLLGEDVGDPLPIGARRKRTHAFPWLTAAITDAVSWRTALYLFARLPWGIVTFAVGLVSVIALWPVMPWVLRAMANVDRWSARVLLAPSELQARIEALESSRTEVVDTAAADLRRIERDLHDGAQARLVNLAMGLGLAKEHLDDPEMMRKLIDEAHGEAREAVRELRDLARGIHPAILTDRGLDAALSHLAGRMAIPVTVSVDMPERPASAIEGTAYFAISELLTNITKHAGAQTAVVDVWKAEDRLMVQVRDDGQGGASEAKGTGLSGLAERIRSVDGVFVVDSPVGGPTTISAELPWRTRD
ncbi:histidine kinase [Mangrovactinospora gilvigrisea]|uniref:histidine kinase n=1 Tax=Mangrovactinospora gilvigrisea TaxID=1428644 RepID=A0A1J7BJC3_9ACTN|nr:sensor histidine kinase [Mangrovactinospora gilvigrisea]OIV38783.1 histidine kinase [Mangrovactinospora gilvigrisea]